MHINKDLLSELLYEKTKDEIISYVKNTEDSVLLHMIAGNYNWDDGLEVPENILKNKNCDLGTVLMIFDLAEGYTFLMGDDGNAFQSEQINFLSDLKWKIENGFFDNQSIKYNPELSGAMKYTLKNAGINEVFIDGTDGKTTDIIIV